jgi:hypothetical protein
MRTSVSCTAILGSSGNFGKGAEMSGQPGPARDATHQQNDVGLRERNRAIAVSAAVGSEKWSVGPLPTDHSPLFH